MYPELRKLKIQKAQELKGDDRCHREYFLIMESFKHVSKWNDNVTRPRVPTTQTAINSLVILFQLYTLLRWWHHTGTDLLP